jgi:O-antigen ligase
MATVTLAIITQIIRSTTPLETRWASHTRIMTDSAAPNRRKRPRSSSANFAPAPSGMSSGRGERADWKTLAALSAAPVLLYAGHLMFGANNPVAALWLTVLLAVSLCVALASSSVRRGLHDISSLTPVAILFGLTVAVALWSLTALAPGGAHPIWAWADAPTASITVNRPATLVEICKLLGLGCIFLVGALQAARSTWARNTVQMVVLLGAIYGLISLLTFISGFDVMSSDRLSGGFLSSNSGATVFGMLTVIGLAALLRDWRQARGLNPASGLGKVALSLASVLIAMTCLLLTASRMGMVSTLLGAAVLLVWELLDAKRDRIHLVIAGGVLLLIALVVAATSNGLLFERFGSVAVDRFARTQLFGPHWNAFLASPLFGYGLGSFSDVNSQITTAQNYADLWSVRAAHNVYLQWLEEAGVIGATPMFFTVAYILVAAVVQAFKLRKGQTLQRGLIAASVVILVHGTVDFGLQVPSIAAFWAFLLGCQFSFGRR